MWIGQAAILLLLSWNHQAIADELKKVESKPITPRLRSGDGGAKALKLEAVRKKIRARADQEEREDQAWTDIIFPTTAKEHHSPGEVEDPFGGRSLQEQQCDFCGSQGSCGRSQELGDWYTVSVTGPSRAETLWIATCRYPGHYQPNCFYIPNALDWWDSTLYSLASANNNWGEALTFCDCCNWMFPRDTELFPYQDRECDGGGCDVVERNCIAKSTTFSCPVGSFMELHASNIDDIPGPFTFQGDGVSMPVYLTLGDCTVTSSGTEPPHRVVCSGDEFTRTVWAADDCGCVTCPGTGLVEEGKCQAPIPNDIQGDGMCASYVDICNSESAPDSSGGAEGGGPVNTEGPGTCRGTRHGCSSLWSSYSCSGSSCDDFPTRDHLLECLDSVCRAARCRCRTSDELFGGVSGEAVTCKEWRITKECDDFDDDPTTCVQIGCTWHAADGSGILTESMLTPDPTTITPTQETASISLSVTVNFSSFFDPSSEPEWPGQIPQEAYHDSHNRTTVTLIINIRYDNQPDQVSWTFAAARSNNVSSVMEESDHTNVRHRRVQHNPFNTFRNAPNVEQPDEDLSEASSIGAYYDDYEVIANNTGVGIEPGELISYPIGLLEPGAVYQLHIEDKGGDGICCANGHGWITVTQAPNNPANTNATVEIARSTANNENAVVWSLPGQELASGTKVFFRVHVNGYVGLLD